jgi:hypothetical protein
MTALAATKTNQTGRKIACAAMAAVSAFAAIACGPNYFEIPIETPIQAKLDVGAFQRVLIAGFVAGGSEDVDANQETVRLLRSQLRTKSSLKVIDADVMQLVEIAQEQNKAATDADEAPPRDNVSGPAGAAGTTSATGAAPADTSSQIAPLPAKIKDEKDIEPYDRLFANTAYWKKIGEEYQNPLIVTGTVLFMPSNTSGFVNREIEDTDPVGRRSVRSERVYQEKKGFVLKPHFIFIDGNTGATLYSESYSEDELYPTQAVMPALSTYFDLMDRIVPNFLSALSSQKIKGTRVLLK